MSVTSNEEGKKWIQASLAVVCILLGYTLISFFEKLAEWFQLETMIPYYYGLTQTLSVIIAGVTFFIVLTNPKSSLFLNSVYQEIMKVVWPDSTQTWVHTFAIMLFVTVLGFVFGFFDFGANALLGLINK